MACRKYSNKLTPSLRYIFKRKVCETWNKFVITVDLVYGKSIKQNLRSLKKS
jgi:hypothetical protein